MSRLFYFIIFSLLSALLCSCEPLPPSGTGGGSVSLGSGTGSAGNTQNGVVRDGAPTPAQRAAAIAAEPLGDYWIGRRYHVDRHRLWGYLRRPRQGWNTAKLVLMEESLMRVPDRLPESGTGLLNGYDNNYEYRIEGRFLSGRTGYDPFANRVLPLFQPRSFTVLEQNPGWLFFPGERYNPTQLTLQPRSAPRS